MSGALAGRCIVVAGAGAGIGRACAERFVAEGARLGCFDRDEAALTALRKRLSGSDLAIFQGDVADSRAVEAAMKAFFEAYGRIDGIVNSAGVDLLAPLEETSDDEWRRVFSVNLDGPMHVCRAGLPYLRKTGGGTIVNVSSGAGLQPLKHRSAYSASKAGLQMFSKALAMEAAEWGIRVNVVAPGAVETRLLRAEIDAAEDPQAAEESVRSRYLLRRIADPSEIAAAVLWLTSAESSYVTGTVVAVDGGRTFH